MATHSSVLAWRTPWTEESGRLQSMLSQRIGHNLAAKPPPPPSPPLSDLTLPSASHLPELSLPHPSSQILNPLSSFLPERLTFALVLLSAWNALPAGAGYGFMVQVSSQKPPPPQETLCDNLSPRHLTSSPLVPPFHITYFIFFKAPISPPIRHHFVYIEFCLIWCLPYKTVTFKRTETIAVCSLPIQPCLVLSSTDIWKLNKCYHP